MSRSPLTSANWVIRTASNADAPQVRHILGDVLAEYGLKADPAGTDRDIEDIEANYLARGGAFDVVVELGRDEIVGMAGLYPIDRAVAELRKMYLVKAARGHGLGRTLLARMLQAAKSNGFRRVELETTAVLKEAIGLYRSSGFAPQVLEQQCGCASRCDQRWALDLSGVETPSAPGIAEADE